MPGARHRSGGSTRRRPERPVQPLRRGRHGGKGTVLLSCLRSQGGCKSQPGGECAGAGNSPGGRPGDGIRINKVIRQADRINRASRPWFHRRADRAARLDIEKEQDGIGRRGTPAYWVCQDPVNIQFSGRKAI